MLNFSFKKLRKPKQCKPGMQKEVIMVKVRTERNKIAKATLGGLATSKTGSWERQQNNPLVTLIKKSWRWGAKIFNNRAAKGTQGKILKVFKNYKNLNKMDRFLEIYQNWLLKF